MLQAIPQTPALDGPRRAIWPHRPYVWAFALGEAPAPRDPIPPGEEVVVAVADGRRPPHAPDDWFTMRVPTIPSVTGPISVAGVRAGDLLQIAIVALAPENAPEHRSLRVTLTGSPSRAPGSTQVMVPPGSVVRLPASRAGGPFSVGPVLADAEDGDVGVPIAARVTLRCTLVSSREG